MSSSCIVALDYCQLPPMWHLIEQLTPQQCRLKIGKEMFTRFGPSLVEQLQKRGFDIFLDLKFHDIPNTVAQAVKAAADLGIWMVNVHACGGERMLHAAKEALVGYGQQAPLLIAVSMLTSMAETELAAIGVHESAQEYVTRLAKLAQNCGLQGMVCSAWEVAKLKNSLDNNHFLFVTPGIRLSTNKADDQQRIMTPLEAKQQGADYLVIGRPITQSADPMATLTMINRMLEEW